MAARTGLLRHAWVSLAKAGNMLSGGIGVLARCAGARSAIARRT